MPSTWGTFTRFAPKLRTLYVFAPKIESTLASTWGTFTFFALKLRALYVFAPKLRALDVFCPQIESTLPSTWGTFTFFVPKLRAPCPQPGALASKHLISIINKPQIEGSFYMIEGTLVRRGRPWPSRPTPWISPCR